MYDMDEQEKDLTRIEKILEFPFFLLVLSLILYAETLTVYFYKLQVFNWVGDSIQIKQHLGLYIVALIVFGVLNSLVFPIIETLLVWCIDQVGFYMRQQEATRKEGFWSWYSLQIEADKQQNSYLQSKVDNARVVHAKNKENLNTLSHRTFSVLIFAAANFLFAGNGLIQTAIAYSIFSMVVTIVCLGFVFIAFFSALVEGSRELKIFYKPNDIKAIEPG